MAVDDHGLEVLKKSGEEVTPGDKSDYYIKVGVVSGGGGGTQYTEGDSTDPAIGTVALHRNLSGDLVAASPTNPLPVDIGGASVTVLGDSKISGTVDGTDSGTERTFVNNRRLQLLSAHDVVGAFTWADFGTKNERVTSIVYTSATFPGITATHTFSYTLVATRYRLDTETWSATPGG